MKLKLLIISILIFSSCITKRNSQEETIVQNHTVLNTSYGSFIYNSNFYFSNGKDSYCIFDTLENTKRLMKKFTLKIDPFPIATLPLEMTFKKSCTESFFK